MCAALCPVRINEALLNPVRKWAQCRRLLITIHKHPNAMKVKELKIRNTVADVDVNTLCHLT